MPGTYVIPMLSHYEPPYYPVIGVPPPSRRLLYPLLNLLHCLRHLPLLKQCERPVTVARCVRVLRCAVHLRLPAHIYSLRVKLMQVEQKCQVAVSVGVALRVQPDALPPVVDCLVIELEFEVGETQVVVELGVVVAEGFSLKEGFNGVFKVGEFVKGDAIVEEAFVRFLRRFFQKFFGY
jgi:hypothetical protein